jgi:hypothetical protein
VGRSQTRTCKPQPSGAAVLHYTTTPRRRIIALIRECRLSDLLSGIGLVKREGERLVFVFSLDPCSLLVHQSDDLFRQFDQFVWVFLLFHSSSQDQNMISHEPLQDALVLNLDLAQKPPAEFEPNQQ